MVSSPTMDNVTPCIYHCVEPFVEDENACKTTLFPGSLSNLRKPRIDVACKAARARHVTKIRVTDWLFLDPSWIPEDGSDLKIT